MPLTPPKSLILLKIQENYTSSSSQHGNILLGDLEMAGMVSGEHLIKKKLG
jgi:hypothetical protein